METQKLLKEKALRTLKSTIRKHMEEKGLTTDEMVQNCGKTRQEVERLINPNEPTNTTIWFIMQILAPNGINPFPEVMRELQKEFGQQNNGVDLR